MLQIPAWGNAPAPTPIPVPIPIQPLVTPAPGAGVPSAAPPTPSVPQMRTATAPADPRGTKRSAETLAPADSESAPPSAPKKCRIDPAQLSAQQQAVVNAIEEGNEGRLRMLLQQSPRLRDALLPRTQGGGITPLSLAAMLGQAGIVTLLAGMGADLEARSGNGGTALMFAAANGHCDVMVMLCQWGANVHAAATNDNTYRTALFYAIDKEHFEACKTLIALGADVQQWETPAPPNDKSPPLPPLVYAIMKGFTELIGWLLDTGRLQLEQRMQHWNTSMLNCAVFAAAMPSVQFLVGRGAKHWIDFQIPGRTSLRNYWELAAQPKRLHVFEYLLGKSPWTDRPIQIEQLLDTTNLDRRAVDLLRHAQLLAGDAHAPVDGLRDPMLRQVPQMILAGLTDADCYGDLDTSGNVRRWWREQGFSICLYPRFPVSTREDLVASVRVLCKRRVNPSAAYSRDSASRAQRLQMVTEFTSRVCGLPDSSQPFSGQKMTAGGESVMNRMVDLQRDLLLQGVAHCRAQFAQQVVTLPDLCMNVYISLSGRVNESDLYRKMTKEWGLYDPIARAVLRLAKEAYAKLQELSPSAKAGEFSALPPAEQMRLVMRRMLKEWDKLPEIAEALLEAANPPQCDLISDLLFQQWRMFGEAFEVYKERYSPLNVPRRPEGAQDVPVPDLPAMDVDAALQ